LLLHWLESPDPVRGVHIATAGGWATRTYAELAADIVKFSTTLRQSGIEATATVPLLVSEPLPFITAFMGVLHAGAVPAPLATPGSFRALDRFTAHLARVFDVAAPGVVVADEPLTSVVTEAARAAGSPLRVIAPPAPAADGTAPPRLPAPERAGDDTALLQFTSGSSGVPKGVAVSWANLDANVRAIRRWLRWSPEDVFATWLPLHHDMGLIGGMITPLVSGTDLWILTPGQFIRSPLRWLECFGRHGATLTTAPSFGYAYTAKRVDATALEGFDFSRWRVAILGAERIDPVAVADFTALTRPFGFDPGALVAAYGMAETTLAVSGRTPGTGSRLVRLAAASAAVGEPVKEIASGTLGVDRVGGNGWLTGCGAPVDGLSVRVVDDEGIELPDGVFGTLRIAGSSVAAGYRTGPGKLLPFTGATLTSGDTGFLLDGEVFVVGRLADSLKVRGVTLHAEDVEAELALVDGLSADRLVVLLGTVDGVHHAVLLAEERRPADPAPAWLNQAAAILRAATAAEATVIIAVGARGAIDRTTSGKPRRRVLWRRLASGDAAGWQPVHGVTADTGRRWTGLAPGPEELAEAHTAPHAAQTGELR
jgi:acyl-CoA synthetase (AMP-forming)/AMP-acid ligase II